MWKSAETWPNTMKVGCRQDRDNVFALTVSTYFSGPGQYAVGLHAFVGVSDAPSHKLGLNG